MSSFDYNDHLRSMNLYGSRNVNDISSAWTQDQLNQQYAEREANLWNQVNHYEEQRKRKEQKLAEARDDIAQQEGTIEGDYILDLSSAIDDINFVNIDDLRGSAYRQAAMHDFGGILGRSFRSEAAKHAGSRELAELIPSEQRHLVTNEFFEALNLAVGTSGRINDWGLDEESSRTGIGKLFSNFLSVSGARDINWNPADPSARMP